MTLCIIPARGGSKGIPNKNLRVIAGRSLVEHSIDHALQAAAVDRVVVSTDSPEITRVSRAAGAEVLERPVDLSGDTATSESALLHVLDTLRDRDGYEPELVIFLQCTSPIRSGRDIDAAVETLRAQSADCVLSVVPSHRFLWRVGPEGASPVNYDPGRRPRRQEMGPQYMENGSIYVFRPAVLREQRARLGGRIALHVMDPWTGFEVDAPEDLALCAWVLDARTQIDRTTRLPAVTRLVVLDFDGVLTDNRVWVTESGEEAVVADRGDGLGLAMLRAAGIEVVVISKEQNPVVAARCRKLTLDFYQGIDDKKTLLTRLLAERDVPPASVIFVGNDINDLDSMAVAGCSVAPADAHPAVLEQAGIVLSRPGGRGAVRELCDLILASRQLS